MARTIGAPSTVVAIIPTRFRLAVALAEQAAARAGMRGEPLTLLGAMR